MLKPLLLTLVAASLLTACGAVHQPLAMSQAGFAAQAASRHAPSNRDGDDHFKHLTKVTYPRPIKKQPPGPARSKGVQANQTEDVSASSFSYKVSFTAGRAADVYGFWNEFIENYGDSLTGYKLEKIQGHILDVDYVAHFTAADDATASHIADLFLSRLDSFSHRDD